MTAFFLSFAFFYLVMSFLTIASAGHAYHESIKDRRSIWDCIFTSCQAAVYFLVAAGIWWSWGWKSPEELMQWVERLVFP